LPSALAQGSESRIYFHKVHMYVVVTLKNVTQNVITYIVKAICASHSLTQSDTLDSDVVDRGLDTKY